MIVVPADLPPDVADLVFASVLPSEAGSPKLREDLLDIWVGVTDAGGSVGSLLLPTKRLWRPPWTPHCGG